MPELVTKEVWFTLTEPELVQRAKDAAAVRSEALYMEEELKEHARETKRLIAKKESELSVLMNAIRTGKELRIVKCEMVKEYEHRKVRFFHDGILVDERPMTAEERQMTLISGGASGELH